MVLGVLCLVLVLDGEVIDLVIYPVHILVIYRKFLLAHRLGKDNIYIADAISPPSAFEKLVSGIV